MSLNKHVHMILQLLDDFEEKLASFTPSALFLFKISSSCFFSWEDPTYPNFSTSTRPIEIKKSQSTKHGVDLVDIFVHVCDESCM